MKFRFTFLASLLILIAVLLPGSTIPDVNVVGFDKIVHTVLFGLWAFAVRYDLRFSKFNFLVVVLIGMSFGMMTEVLQIFAEERNFDLYDALADAIGLIVGLLVWPKIVAIIKQ
jgi:VanZ family protein